ncbi:MAG TPA: V-type ATP synthase subunit E [Coriobacteriia bacterium]|nr:V-type ATP synthase subunit E [Coriobacteriia bacterium]
MALADIISRIESDAEVEAARITEAAQKRAAEIVAEAQRRAEAHHDSSLAEADTAAHREADRIVVSARLKARDEALVQRRALVDVALTQTADALAAAPADEYARFLAERVARVARGGETLRFGSADSARADAVVDALRVVAPGLSLTVSSEPAPFARGALVEGSRVRADLSLNAIVEERRDELELVIASVLFAEEA